MPELGFALEMAAVIAGALGGTLLGVAGGVGGTLARRGERRHWIDVVFGGVAALGVVTAIGGMVAGALNQPAPAWFGLFVVGGGLIFFAWGIRRHIGVIRAQAPSSRILVPGEAGPSR